MDLILRDYQEDAVAAIAQAYREGYDAVFYVLPTGGGKSPIFTFIAKNGERKGKKNLTLAHRKELVNQARKHLRNAGVNSGLIMGGKPMALTWLVQVGSAQTVVRRLDTIPRPDLITEDEGHHGTDNTHQTIFNRWGAIGEPEQSGYIPPARILRVSATPWDMAGKGVGLKNRKEKLIIGPSMKELIRRGYLVQPIVFSPPLSKGTAEELDRVKRGADGDLSEAEQEKILNKPSITGCVVKHYRELCDGKPVIVFCSTVKHAADVAQQFCEAGIRAEMIDGTDSDSERDRMISGLATLKIKVLTTADLIGEGVDIPVVYASIMLRRTDSLRIFLQQSGRMGRPVYAPGYDLSTDENRLAAIAASDKPFGLLIDHVGNVGKFINGEFKPKHGLPDQDREWDLGPRKKRTKKEKDEEPVQALRMCPQCWATHAIAPVCPQCGWVYLLKQRKGPEIVEGQLIPVNDAAAKMQQKIEYRAELKKAKTLAELIAFAVKHGHHPKWAEKQHQFRREAAARHTQKYYETIG